ncbi:DUF1304 domain-containing protein [Deinococcus psychrotolerans]|uniref:DUF1304 domain-containing protein n=1 Tax=Deinococcus psychrotolerans TaxID=2489213 RepID=A0A3G8YE62_9DEIO|nr:DUF1304 domain-containing protein [Deinococcus psychrotolerans]AZI43669.1 DUF1304 domain-containing protein [Deinococcus psychrotolerans]
MHLIALILVALVAVEHLYILVLEMFLWRTERTRRTFGVSAELAEQTVTMAGNQGLYNGFLAVGLIWGLIGQRQDVMTFFLICVIVAGLYGAATVSPRIALMQALPAGLALLAVWLT